MILADKIIRLRKKNNWSQEELAGKLQISRQSVSKWESASSIPDLDNIIKLSEIFGVSTDYLLKDEEEDEGIAQTMEAELQDDKHHVNVEEVMEYVRTIEKTSVFIAWGVVLCILGPAFLIMMQCLAIPSKAGAAAMLSEQQAGSFGVVALLLFCAAGVILLVSNGMKTSKYEYFEKEELYLDYGVKGIVEKKKTQYEPRYRNSITIGVALCILAVVPLLCAAGLEAADHIYLLLTGLLLVMIAVAVYLFVHASMIYGSYIKVLQVEDYTKENKLLHKKTDWFAGAYWCFVTALYLLISFVFNCWNISWVIWPVAGVFYVALHQMIKHNIEKNQEV